MSLSLNYSSGVYLEEEDRAGRVSPIATSIGAAVFAANKGSVGVAYPTTSVIEFLDRYTENNRPNAQVSLSPYSIIEFLKVAPLCYTTRVAGSGALIGGVTVSQKTANQLTGPTPVGTPGVGETSTLADGAYSYKITAVDAYGESLVGTAGGATVVTSPTHATLTTSLTGANNDLKYTSVATGTAGNSNTVRYVDPGGNNAALSINITPSGSTAALVVNLATDGAGAITTTASQIVAALALQGTAFTNYMTVELAASNTGAGVVTALSITNLAGGAATGANDGQVSLAWPAVTGATGYKVYGRTTGSYLLMGTVETNAFVDTGAVTPAGVVPVANTTNDIKIEPFSVGLADPATEYSFASGDMFIVYAENPGTWNNDIRVAITDVDTTEGTFVIELYKTGQTVPFYRENVSREDYIDGFGQQLNMEERVNSLSKDIRVRNNASDTQAVDKNVTTPVNMSGGVNGSTVTNSQIANAWDIYADPEEVDVRLLINGGNTAVTIQHKMDEIATNRKDCFAILDVPSLSQETSAALTYRNTTLNLDSSYSGLFTPDVQIVDQYNDKLMYVPPSGYVASVMATTDANRAPWFAPAGMERGGVRGLKARYKYNQGQRNLLAKAQVNYIRTFSGAGLKLWEQFTLQAKASPLQLINVRMLLIYLQASISQFLLFSVQEPNDNITRSRIIARIRDFLDVVKGARGLYRYDVVCDDSNNKPQDVAEGTLNVDVYVDPVIPARRIRLKTIITPTGAEFKEEVVSNNA